MATNGKKEEPLNMECWVCATKFHDSNYPSDDKLRRGLCSQECAARQPIWSRGEY